MCLFIGYLLSVDNISIWKSTWNINSPLKKLSKFERALSKLNVELILVNSIALQNNPLHSICVTAFIDFHLYTAHSASEALLIITPDALYVFRINWGISWSQVKYSQLQRPLRVHQGTRFVAMQPTCWCVKDSLHSRLRMCWLQRRWAISASGWLPRWWK